MRSVPQSIRYGSLSVLVLTGLGVLAVGPMATPDDPPPTKMPSKMVGAGQNETDSTADHSKFEVLQQEFATGPDVTKACLTCHTEAAHQIMATEHWTWLDTKADPIKLADGSERLIGKADAVVNNFCVAVVSNEPRCTSCHVGYGWKDQNFDFTDQTKVDCLVCHDQTGLYKKFPTAAGNPVLKTTPKAKREWPKGKGKFWEPAPLMEIAQKVGKPTRQNCGTCHFFGGGGEGVKHGDMDQTLAEPHGGLDVHMDVDGPNFSCTECHTTHKHRVSGRFYEPPIGGEGHEFVMRGTPGQTDFLACESCHTESPHEDKYASILNGHTDRVSCQACHIPTFAVERPTKMWWDWSVAGQKNDKGKPLVKKIDLKGTKVLQYHGKKGEFIYAMDEVPEYRWFNGKMDQVYLGQTIDTKTPGRERGLETGKFDKMDLDKPVVAINTMVGSHDDPLSMIWPVKVHRGIQPYDPVNNVFVVPKLFGKKPTGAYWANFDWQKSITAGMTEGKLEYSGEFEWIQTEMNWPLTHMVRPGDEAVGCVECHQRGEGGRIANLGGFYLPGRDFSQLWDWIGLGFIVITIIGVSLHAIGRVVLTGGKS